MCLGDVNSRAHDQLYILYTVAAETCIQALQMTKNSGLYNFLNFPEAVKLTLPMLAEKTHNGQ